jgi:hypothetical protein
MKVGSLYFDEKDLLMVFTLALMAVLKYFQVDVIPFFLPEQIFIVLLLAFIVRIFLGKRKEELILITVIISLFLSNVLSLLGLVIFLLVTYSLFVFVFRKY